MLKLARCAAHSLSHLYANHTAEPVPLQAASEAVRQQWRAMRLDPRPGLQVYQVPAEHRCGCCSMSVVSLQGSI